MDDKYINDNYILIKQLGKGGFGSVFLVKRKFDGKEVALKKIVVVGNDKAFEKANMEVEMLKMISEDNCHPFISCYYDHHVDLANNVIYIEMEYIKGVTLNVYFKELLKKADKNNVNMVFDASYKIIKYITQALDYIHNLGILHNDIKPANIVIDENGYPNLVDFGVGCLTKKTSQEFCKNIAINSNEPVNEKCCLGGGGTFVYMPPERILSGVRYPKSDVWSLGATLYAVFENELVWPQVTSKTTIKDLEMIMLLSEPNKLDTSNLKLDTLINGMITKDINERLSTQQILDLLNK